MGLARLLQVEAPLPARSAFAGSWLLAQALGHAVFPLARLSYGKTAASSAVGPGAAATALVVLAAAGGVAWATQPPVVHLSAGVHQGPLVLDHSQHLIGEPGASSAEDHRQGRRRHDPERDGDRGDHGIQVDLSRTSSSSG